MKDRVREPIVDQSDVLALLGATIYRKYTGAFRIPKRNGIVNVGAETGCHRPSSFKFRPRCLARAGCTPSGPGERPR